MSLSPDQLAQRLEGIAATDVAALVGCNPYQTPLDVYLRKIGAAPPFLGNLRTRWGEILEGPLRDDYAERHNVHIETRGTFVHPKYGWWFATPDGLVYPHGAREPTHGLELKVHGRDAVFFGQLEYGSPGTDEVPPHELIQCMWGMGCTGLPFWRLVAFLDGAPNEYTIWRDDELIGMLREQAERFLVDHVRRREPPPPDGSKAWDDFLKSRWKKNGDGLLKIDNDPEKLQKICALRDMLGEAADLQTRTEKVIQELKNEIADQAGFTWREPGRKPWSKLTWKRNKDGERQNLKATVEKMRTTAALFASGHGPSLERAAKLLQERAAGERAEIDDRALADLILDTQRVLTEIAKTQTVMTPVPGARPFNVPRWWANARQTETDDETDNTEEN